MKKEIKIVLISTFLLCILIIVLSMTIFAKSTMYFDSIKSLAREKFDWDDEQYNGWKCTDFSRETEKWFETELNVPCLLVYGSTNDTGHVWNLVYLYGDWREFESTSLCFQNPSEKYNINDISQGYYINGKIQTKHHLKCGPYSNYIKGE